MHASRPKLVYFKCSNCGCKQYSIQPLSKYLYLVFYKIKNVVVHQSMLRIHACGSALKSYIRTHLRAI